MGTETLLSKANTTFALALYKKFSEADNTGNIFYSPFSISAALAMVKLGAAGNTATQMSEVLGFSAPGSTQPEGNGSQISVQTQCTQIQKPQDDRENVNVSFALLLRELNKPDALYALNIANRLYGEQTFAFNEMFLAETLKFYNAQLETMDFRSSAEVSRISINKWVEEQTKGKITNLLPPDSVGSLTKLVLVNAIYFKGKWDAQFEEELTVDAEFRLNKTDKKPVKMMRQKTKFLFSYHEEVKCKVLELPYKEKDLSMILILPDDIEDDTTGLEKLEKELTYDKFKEWTGNDRMVEVDVSLPRFKMEESYDMREVLISMGMVDAFDVSKSDFSGMSEAKNLAVSAVFHKAFVEVNEEGTEAAAATGVVFNLTSAPGRIPQTFHADHPFLFFIRHNSSKSVLFAGRFSSPK